jgi:hypothetical protein
MLDRRHFLIGAGALLTVSGPLIAPSSALASGRLSDVV